MPTKYYDFDNQQLEKLNLVYNGKDEAEELLLLTIRGEVIRLHEEKSKRSQQQIREFISKSYDQLIAIRGTR